ncbi:MAG: tyrosine-protein phosphatase [Acidobacteria bacterium]|nr:tyrosine-protein phosphatase [Acidobacteriota bacterium]
MKKLDNQTIRLALALALVSLTAIAQQPEPRDKELPNFHKVNQQLYRGGQPKKGGLKKLADLGIKTIVNLRGESDDTHGQEDEAKRLGLRYFNIPMSSTGRPTEEQVRRVLEIIETQDNAPLFIHCRRGADRTGVIIAIFRIKHDGWTAERAIDEAKSCGLGLVQFQKRDYIKDYFERLERENTKQTK